jgi:glycine cleavage system regulatory protein
MSSPFVLTVIGRDKPGLVGAVATAVASEGGNWLESRMLRLGGQFAGILRIEIEAEKEEALARKLRGLQEQGLQVAIHHTQEGTSEEGEDRVMKLELIGQDRPGIVQQISRILARNGVNVEELYTECSSAPMTGEMLFQAAAEIRIPAGCEIERLKGDLERIAADLMVEIRLGDGGAAS